MTPRLDASKYMMSGPMQALLRLQKEVEAAASSVRCSSS